MRNNKVTKQEICKVGDLVKRMIAFYGPFGSFLEPGSLGIIVKIVRYGPTKGYKTQGYKVLTRIGVVDWFGDYSLKKI